MDCLCAPKRRTFKGTIRSNLTIGLDQELSDQELSDQELWQALEIAQAKDFVSERKDSWMPLLRQEGEISRADKTKAVDRSSSLAPSSVSRPR